MISLFYGTLIRIFYQNKNSLGKGLHITRVCKGVAAPIFKALTPRPSLTPFLKYFFPLPSFLFNPLVDSILDSSPHPHATLSCPFLNNQTSLF